jgi:CO/xanthine dehydrogenase FAD-binding subunit
MITTYHRPKTLDEALTLLTQPNTVPLGGGTLLAQGTPDPVSVVDLQHVGLDSLTIKGNELEIGATCTLQSLFESEHCPAALKSALKLEAPLNIRNTATVAGTLVSSDGRSTFAAMLLAMDAKLEINVNRKSSIVNCGEYLLTRPSGLITSISIPLNLKTAFEFVSKTPADPTLPSARRLGRVLSNVQSVPAARRISWNS